MNPQNSVDTDAYFDSELEWLRLVEAGATAIGDDQLEVAGASWRQALEVTKGFADHDPRRATSLNNLGVLAHIMGKPQEADQLYRDALEAWVNAGQWVEAMTLTQRAHSSLFHLRLESGHRHHYDRLARLEQLEVLKGALAITKSNYADLRSHLDSGGVSSSSVKTPIFDEPLLARAEQEIWTIDRPPEFIDEGRLMASRECSCVIERAAAGAGVPQ